MTPAVDLRPWQQPEAIKACLSGSRIAVVGLSSNPARPSYGVAAYLLQAGFDVIPVNPKRTSCWVCAAIRIWRRSRHH